MPAPRSIPVALAGLLFLLAALPACESIGNQHFYGLESPHHAPIDRAVFRAPRLSEHGNEKVPGHLQAENLYILEHADGATTPLMAASADDWNNADPLEAVIRMEIPMTDGAVRRSGGTSRGGDGGDGDEDGGAGEDDEGGAGAPGGDADPTPAGGVGSLGTTTNAVEGGTPVEVIPASDEPGAGSTERSGNGWKPTLDASDQIIVSFPHEYYIPNFRRGLLRLRDDAYYYFSLLDIDKEANPFGRLTARLRLTQKVDPATLQSRRGRDVLPELSFKPLDANFPLYAIAPTLNPGNHAQKIGPGMPLALVANRLYLGRIGELLGDTPLTMRLDSGEIAVVVSVSEGANEQETFLAFYHEAVARETFVPSWGSVLYSTENWSGDPITIKLQVFDLDGQENAFLQGLLSTATDAISQAQPQARSVVGIAGALGDMLIKQNTDDEIMRFEFTFVNDSDWDPAKAEALVPYDRSYILLRPDQVDGEIPPEHVSVNDQWRAREHDDSWFGENEGVDSLDSYFTFTVSSTIQVPAALMEKRKREFDDLLQSGQVARLSGEERVAIARQAAQSMVSAVEYLPLFQDLMRYAAEGAFAELLEIAKRLKDDEAEAAADGGQPLLTSGDRDSLLRSLKRKLRDDLAGVTSWAGAATKLEALASTQPATPVPAGG